MEEDIESYKKLPVGVLLEMKDGERVKLTLHFDDKFFSGIYESRRYDNHDYHFLYNDIESIICF